jgi:hypothetical protein
VAMRDLGRPVEYLVAPDEGHGFAGRENRIAMYAAVERFLAEHVGGRHQPDMPTGIRQRLSDLTVDPASVTLAAAPAVAAPITERPAFDLSRLDRSRFEYQVTIQMQGQQIQMDVTRTVETASEAGRPVWRVMDAGTGPMVLADTIVVDRATTAPIRRAIRQGPATVNLAYTDAGITGQIQAGPQNIPVQVALAEPLTADGGALDLAIATLPLAHGYTTRFNTFNVMMQSVTPYELRVTGTETVTVPAGTYETYVVESRRADGEAGHTVSYVPVDGPRVMVRTVSHLPPAMGGGTATMELKSAE